MKRTPEGANVIVHPALAGTSGRVPLVVELQQPGGIASPCPVLSTATPAYLHAGSPTSTPSSSALIIVLNGGPCAKRPARIIVKECVGWGPRAVVTDATSGGCENAPCQCRAQPKARTFSWSSRSERMGGGPGTKARVLGNESPACPFQLHRCVTVAEETSAGPARRRHTSTAAGAPSSMSEVSSGPKA
jgi:hypothetical protein